MLLVSEFTFTHMQTLEPCFCLLPDRVTSGREKKPPQQSQYNWFSGHSRLSPLPGTAGCEARDFSCAYTALHRLGQSLTWTTTMLMFSWLCTRFVRLLCLVLSLRQTLPSLNQHPYDSSTYNSNVLLCYQNKLTYGVRQLLRQASGLLLCHKLGGERQCQHCSCIGNRYPGVLGALQKTRYQHHGC